MPSDERKHSSSPVDAPPDPTPSLVVSSTSLKSQCSVAPARPLRFLVVDDSKMNRKMLCRLLEKQGHVCTEAEDGVQAVAIMRTLLTTNPQPLVGDDDEMETKESELQDDEGGGRAACWEDTEKGVGNTAFDMILMDFM